MEMEMARQFSTLVTALALAGALAASIGPAAAQRHGPPINPDRVLREEPRPATPPVRNGAPMNPAQIFQDQQQPLSAPPSFGNPSTMR
jgi:hypothetical protein